MVSLKMHLQLKEHKSNSFYKQISRENRETHPNGTTHEARDARLQTAYSSGAHDRSKPNDELRSA